METVGQIESLVLNGYYRLGYFPVFNREKP